MNRYSRYECKKTIWLQKAKCLVLSEDGATFAEYGLLITLIAVACYLGVSTFGKEGVAPLFEDPRIEKFLSGG